MNFKITYQRNYQGGSRAFKYLRFYAKDWFKKGERYYFKEGSDCITFFRCYIDQPDKTFKSGQFNELIIGEMNFNLPPEKGEYNVYPEYVTEDSFTVYYEDRIK